MRLEKKSAPNTRELFRHPRLPALLAILIILTIFGCQIKGEKEPYDGEKKTMIEYLSSHYAKPVHKQPVTEKISMSLFKEKCSRCHQPDRALTVFKDPDVWAQTIRRMQYYSKGEITDSEAKKLVDFHVTRQQIEVDNFKDTCTKCHDDERINSRSMSEKQWLETIKRMQQKAPELISDEKIILLADYFHRRELAMARIFYDKCPLCHLSNSGKDLSPNSNVQINGLIVLASEEFGQSFQVKDAKSTLASHVERQKRNSQLYENNCTLCHADSTPKKEELDKLNPGQRTRSEWIFFIATLQGVGFSKEIQKSINSQIDFHISRH